MQEKLTEVEWLQNIFDELNLIEENQITTLCHKHLYQQIMKKDFDKNFRPHVFREGDLMLKQIQSFLTESRGKFTPNYDNPYVVKRAFLGGTLIFKTMDGE